MTHHPDLKCPSPEELSQLLPAYQVLELTSESPRDATYRARQISLDRIVSIKLLSEEIGNDPALRQAFENDAKAMAKLKHPNLVDVFDFGVVEGMLYIITEYIPGRSLHETTHGNYIKQNDALQLVSDICNGLIQAHNAGIIHRNLNPTHILLDDDGHAKIVDFGISSNDDASTKNHHNRYHAPETIGSEADMDAHCDIYSLGIIFYELLTGFTPDLSYVKPSSIHRIHPQIDAIIERAIHPDPKQRYSCADEMADDLREVIQKLETPTTRPVVTPRATPALGGAGLRASTLSSASNSNHSGLIVMVILLIVVVAVIFVVSQSNKDSDNNQKQQTNTISQNQTQKPNPSTSKKQPRPPHKNRPKPPRPAPPAEPIHTDDSDQPSPPTDAIVENSETEQEIPKPEPKPEPAPPVKPSPPTFDITAFLTKARTYMQEKEKNLLADYDKALLRNIDSFERDAKRAIRRLNRNIRKPLEIQTETEIESFRKMGKIPDDTDLLDEKLLKSLKPIHAAALYDQKKIDSRFLLQFTKSRIIYIKGIDHQISILKKEADNTNAALLEEEIDLTQKDIERYIRILRGLPADPPPVEDEEGAAKEGEDGNGNGNGKGKENRKGKKKNKDNPEDPAL